MGGLHIGDGSPMRFKISVFEMFCNDTEDLKEAVNCIDRKTFNRSETILDKESDLVRFVSQDDKFWTEDVTESYFGRWFK